MISTVIVAKDDPPYLFNSIKSVADLSDDIIVVDIGLNKNIVKKLNDVKSVKVVTIGEPVPYVELIREKTKNYAKNNYVLFLDPDEEVPAPLAEMLKKIYQQYDYIKVPRKNIVFGKWIEHSRWWPDYQVRLFKKDMVVWSKKIHEQPAVKGNGFTVEAHEKMALLHHNYDSIDDFMQKMIRYAKAEASPSFSLSHGLKKGLSEFISRYFASDGYKDGVHGLSLALLQMFYYFLVFLYSWEKNRYSQEDKNATTSVFNFFKRGVEEINFWLSKKQSSSIIDRVRRKLYIILTKLL